MNRRCRPFQVNNGIPSIFASTTFNSTRAFLSTALRDCGLEAYTALALSAGFFSAEFTVAPMWAIPMDIAPTYSGTASGMMNTGSAFAAIVSPVVFGYIVDKTGHWTWPFTGSMALMLLGAALSFAMHPDRPLTEKTLMEAPITGPPISSNAGPNDLVRESVERLALARLRDNRRDVPVRRLL